MSDAHYPARIPNAETRKAIEEAETILASRSARFASVEELMADLASDDGPEDETSR